MMRALVVTIVAIAVIFLAITAIIIGAKAWREMREAWRRSRRRVLEPLVLAHAHGSDASLLPALGGRLKRRDRAVLEEILLDHIHRVRGIEKERLGKVLDDLGYVDRYLARLGSSRWWSRADAAEKLGLTGVARSTPRLVEAMGDPSHEVRLRSAKALGIVGGTAAIHPLIATLAEPNRWSTIRMADILSSMGPEVSVELIHAWPQLGRHARLAALDILGRIRSLAAIEFLRKRLDESDADVRARACHALGAIGDAGSGEALIERLRDDAWPVRAMAAKALGRVQHKAAVGPLTGALRDREWWVRANAAESLRALGDSGLDALEKMLDDNDVYARHQAVIMLQETGRLDAQVDRLAGSETDREASRRFVLRFIQAGQTGRLRELSERHATPAVRRELTAMLPPPEPETERAAR